MKSKCSNDPYLPKTASSLLFPLRYIINHQGYLGCFMQLYNRMAAQVLAFPWAWVNVKVSQTGIKKYSLVGLAPYQIWKKSVSQISRHWTIIIIILIICFITSRQQSSLLRILYKMNLAWAPTNQQAVATCWISSKSTAKVLRKWTQTCFISHTSVTLSEGQGPPNWFFKNVELSSPYVIPSLKCLNTSQRWRLMLGFCVFVYVFSNEIL